MPLDINYFVGCFIILKLMTNVHCALNCTIKCNFDANTQLVKHWISHSKENVNTDTFRNKGYLRQL